MFVGEGLLRFARNDNVPYVIKGIASVIARVLSEAISRFHNGELVAALLRYEISCAEIRAICAICSFKRFYFFAIRLAMAFLLSRTSSR
ncbi:MAG: hypothetical protein BROFUL_00673 [Candidatus Brocadia fulgida]|uniref:Uncharacterized protein n=1 Tax=Candidatus Brocadia fulgida TaxID=380242 RepID=A0A0M2UYA9_9BACT|nr:MAG: hypothetical protein BROFUL_00673 [Candidatus Brocadia fulgida]MBV6518956.1 hypothetical protein [Candidatus Brocadia fulgida]